MEIHNLKQELYLGSHHTPTGKERLRVTRKQAIEAMGGDWAQLLEDLLINISKRFKCVEDLIAFSAVCSSWRAVSSIAKLNWTPTMPWLIMPENQLCSPSSTWTVLNPSTNKHCRVKVSENFGLECYPCGDGWIFVHGNENKLYLFNPLTRAQVRLPSALTLPAMADISEEYNELSEKEWARRTQIRSVALVKIPRNNGFLVLVVSDFYHLAFTKPGDIAWSAAKCADDYFGMGIFVEDVIAYTDQILIICGGGRLTGFGVDLLLSRVNMDVTLEEYVPGQIDGLVSIVGPLENFYLVESSGDLLLVQWYTNNFRNEEDMEKEEDFLSSDFPTSWFKVYKLDSVAKDWAVVFDLGDLLLFVGNHSNVAVCSSNANCRLITRVFQAQVRVK